MQAQFVTQTVPPEPNPPNLAPQRDPAQQPQTALAQPMTVPQPALVAQQPPVATQPPSVYYGITTMGLANMCATPNGATFPRPTEGLLVLYRDSTWGPIQEPQMLPSVADPNNFQANRILGTESQQSVSLEFLGNYVDPKAPTFQFGLQDRPGIFYDTGSVGSGTFTPGNIAIDHTAHNAGQLTFALTGNIQNSTLVTPAVQQTFQNNAVVQVNSELFTVNDQQFQARTAYVRVLDPNSQNDFLVGTGPTLFGNMYLLPILGSNGALPVGAVGIASAGQGYTGVQQLRYVRRALNVFDAKDDLEAGVSIEDQAKLDSDIENGATNNVVHRYPTTVVRLSYSDSALDTYQVAALVRPIGFNDAHFNDHFVVGWGVSAAGGVYLTPNNDAIYFGAAGGSGLGQYIFGASQGAVINNGTSISTLSEVGAFVSYQRVWYQNTAKHSSVMSNVAVGYVDEETARASDNRHLEQAWCNVVWNYNQNATVGLEYQYGDRVTAAGQRGQDNRFMLIVQITTSGSLVLSAPANAADFGAYDSSDVRSRSLLGL